MLNLYCLLFIYMAHTMLIPHINIKYFDIFYLKNSTITDNILIFTMKHISCTDGYTISCTDGNTVIFEIAFFKIHKSFITVISIIKLFHYHEMHLKMIQTLKLSHKIKISHYLKPNAIRDVLLYRPPFQKISQRHGSFFFYKNIPISYKKYS